MKLQTRQIEAFVKKPSPGIRAVLVYGPDGGLIRERGKALSLTVVRDLNDPFNAAHLTGEILETDPSRLMDEVNAQSLMGGTRLVRITDAPDGLAVPLKDWLKSNPGDGTFLVLEAGDLKPRSPLRKLFEEAENAAALPCYVEDERDIAGFIREQLKETGLTIQNDALALMAATVKGDRGRARMEVEKLTLYKGSNTAAITLDDVQQSCGDAGSQSLDDLVYAATGGNSELALRSFRRLLDDGIELIVLERSLQNHISRLHMVRTMMDQGRSIDDAMKTLQPPVFFKQADMFRAQVTRFSAARLRQLMLRLAQTEAKTKQTGTPAETLLSDFVLKASSL